MLPASIWLQTALAFVGWPYFAGLFVFKSITGREAAKDTQTSRLDLIRVEMENRIIGHESITLLFEFRDIFYRYTGLSQEAANVSAAKGSSELFKIADGGNRDLSAKCMARRNARRLDFHRNLAAREFVDFMATVPVFERDHLIIQAIAICDELADAATRAELSDLLFRLAPETTRPAPAAMRKTA